MKAKNRLTIGILADVDAGKTTLSEAILFTLGMTRSFGRVDHGDAFLDTYSQEKERGITIFSKPARFSLGDKEFVLLDTPGHTDFSAETERAMQVLDYAILVVSGADGVSGAVRTLWKLSGRYGVPVFLFLNKMDQPGTDCSRTVSQLQRELSEACILFDRDNSAIQEQIALCDEELLDAFLTAGEIPEEKLADSIRARRIFPCFSGSALRLQGIREFLDGLDRYTCSREYPAAFGARVYKIFRDGQGNRLTEMKITGGSLRVRDAVCGEKVSQIRIYNGSRYETAAEASAGMICAVTGPLHTYSGQGLGFEPEGKKPVLDTVLTCQMILSDGTDCHKVFTELSVLNEELPELHILWKEEKGQIQVQMMGEMQKEILQELIRRRFGLEISFGEPAILYKETIKAQAEGIGHFEPLRHYAEVHLLLTPLPEGSGLVFDSICGEDALDRNWQRLILTHLREREHPGVLTGSPITDMKISVAAGKSHEKHTEGGDFRQATCRAVRQGLCRAESVLLEPYYDFRLELPAEAVGRAMSDIERMAGNHRPPEIHGACAVLTGQAPVAQMNGYAGDVRAYTKGEGSLFCIPAGYFPCHNPEEVVKASGYSFAEDAENPAGSVFCAHGSGVYVPWNEVEQHMHLPSCLKAEKPVSEPEREGRPAKSYSEEELEAIFRRTYGTGKREKSGRAREARLIRGENRRSLSQTIHNDTRAEEVLLVDGYNMIFAWKELSAMAKDSLAAARELLTEMLQNYQGYTGKRMILVFDAYKPEGNPGSTEKLSGLEVVYTKEGQTADQYIEKYVLEKVKKQRITVATSDGMEQRMVFGQGALRMPARELRERILGAEEELRENFIGKNF